MEQRLTSVRLIIVCLALAGCASVQQGNAPEIPAEAARHRAALATVVVSNSTLAPLAIAYRTANAPIQEVGIGNVAPGQKARMAPVPAGEPIVLIARRVDGTELSLAPRMLVIDDVWTWEISHTATFAKPETEK